MGSPRIAPTASGTCWTGSAARRSWSSTPVVDESAVASERCALSGCSLTGLALSGRAPAVRRHGRLGRSSADWRTNGRYPRRTGGARTDGGRCDHPRLLRRRTEAVACSGQSSDSGRIFGAYAHVRQSSESRVPKIGARRSPRTTATATIWSTPGENEPARVLLDGAVSALNTCPAVSVRGVRRPS
jgi:hypothetical protein